MASYAQTIVPKTSQDSLIWDPNMMMGESKVESLLEDSICTVFHRLAKNSTASRYNTAHDKASWF
jgi:hypothetical protein